jgi:hypothetical protein
MKSVGLPDRCLDIIVFCLSLMNKNWPDHIAEARRCLVTNGTLLIAVTTKSLTERLCNLKDVLNVDGLDIYYEKEQPPFTFIEANKRDSKGFRR